MALDFHETETLLTSEFLTDHFITSENQKITRNCLRTPESILNWFGSCGSSSSGFGTPVGSELGSTETESDEDDFVAELTRQMADYMLQEDDENTAPTCVSANSKCSDCNLGSKQRHDQRLISTPCKPSSVPAHAKNTDVGLCSNQGFTDHQIRAIRFYQLKNQQLLKHQGSVCWGRSGEKNESTQQLQKGNQQNYTKNRDTAIGIRLTALGPPLQAGSGMRAVFLGGSRSRSGSSGTGVFLPRGTGNPQEPRKKKGYATVLIPAKVEQALQLHFNPMNALLPSDACHPFAAQPVARSDNMYSEQRRHSESAVDHHEIGLPQEWTY